MRGDALASGEKRATFTLGKPKFSEEEMKKDLQSMSMTDFINKYMITERAYELIKDGDQEHVSAFAEEMKHVSEVMSRQIAVEEAQEEATQTKECFLTPFVPIGLTGRVIVKQDVPPKRRGTTLLLPPKSKRDQREILPTTGHIIKAVVFKIENGEEVSDLFVGLRIMFSPMSGTAVMFKGYPFWRQLELSEILSTLEKEDVEMDDTELESMI